MGGSGREASVSSASGSGGAGGAGGAATTTSSASASSAASSGAGGAMPMDPDFDSIPWQQGAGVGFGVARKDSENSLGENAFIGYGGYNVPLDAACAWTTALYHATLKDRGVRYVYCVQGPSDPSYSQFEIGNSKIVKNLLTQVGPATHFILALAHSSGSFVAHELLGQLHGGLDPNGLTDQKVVYFDLDGGTSGLTAPIVDRLRNAYFVGAHDGSTGTNSPNLGVMQNGGAAYAGKGGFFQYDASGSGCDAGAKWCVHISLINQMPHDPANAQAVNDYSDFNGHPVTTAYIAKKAAEAGLAP
jgi:hypothetical protein